METMEYQKTELPGSTESVQQEPAQQKKPKKIKAAKTAEQQLLELEQQMDRLKQKKKKLQKKKEKDERKKRDHAMILVGAHLLTFFSESEKEDVLQMNDDDIKKWVEKQLKVNSVGQAFLNHYPNEKEVTLKKNENEIHIWVDSKFSRNN